MAELHDLVAPYALDALDPAEAARFELHLETCSECRAELIELSEVAADIADGVAVPPPPEIKESVMASIGGSESREVSIVDIRSRTSRLAWTVAAAAAVIAFVFFGLWTVASSDLSEANQIAAVYEAPDAVVVSVESSNGPARFVFSPTLGSGVFNGASLTQLDDNEVYELWLIGEESVEPAGTLNPGDSAVLVDGVGPGLTLAMTVELAPGTETPSSDPLFAAEL